MVVVKSVKIDGESIYVFNSAIYIFASNSGFTLQLDIVVSEVILKKYRKVENIIIEIELEDGRIINSIMHVKILPGGLPQLNLFCEIDDIDEYLDFSKLNENSSFPNIEEGITLKDIRKVEMPYEEVRFKLTLPIDQAEWLCNQKKEAINEVFKAMINDLWKNESE